MCLTAEGQPEICLMCHIKVYDRPIDVCAYRNVQHTWRARFVIIKRDVSASAAIRDYGRSRT